jgi:excisionase family DNA binding protein
MTAKLLLTVEEAAEVLSLGRTKVYELIAAGEIPTVKIGRARRVSAKALTVFVGRLDAGASE